MKLSSPCKETFCGHDCFPANKVSPVRDGRRSRGQLIVTEVKQMWGGTAHTGVFHLHTHTNHSNTDSTLSLPVTVSLPVSPVPPTVDPSVSCDGNTGRFPQTAPHWVLASVGESIQERCGDTKLLDSFRCYISVQVHVCALEPDVEVSAWKHSMIGQGAAWLREGEKKVKNNPRLASFTSKIRL